MDFSGECTQPQVCFLFWIDDILSTGLTNLLFLYFVDGAHLQNAKSLYSGVQRFLGRKGK